MDAVGYGSDVVFVIVFIRFRFVFVFMGISVYGVVVSSVIHCYSFKALSFFDVGSIVNVDVTYCVKRDTFVFGVKRVKFFVECV